MSDLNKQGIVELINKFIKMGSKKSTIVSMIEDARLKLARSKEYLTFYEGQRSYYEKEYGFDYIKVRELDVEILCTKHKIDWNTAIVEEFEKAICHFQ